MTTLIQPTAAQGAAAVIQLSEAEALSLSIIRNRNRISSVLYNFADGSGEWSAAEQAQSCIEASLQTLSDPNANAAQKAALMQIVRAFAEILHHASSTPYQKNLHTEEEDSFFFETGYDMSIDEIIAIGEKSKEVANV